MMSAPGSVFEGMCLCVRTGSGSAQQCVSKLWNMWYGRPSWICVLCCETLACTWVCECVCVCVCVIWVSMCMINTLMYSLWKPCHNREKSAYAHTQTHTQTHTYLPVTHMCRSISWAPSQTPYLQGPRWTVNLNDKWNSSTPTLLYIHTALLCICQHMAKSSITVSANA